MASNAGLEYKDYYKVLGVPKTASPAEVKKAFRKLARQHRPDAKPGDAAAERRFKEINEANEVLRDPAKRAQYDELGANWDSIARARAAGGAGGDPFGGFRRGAPGGGNVRYEFHTTGDAGEFSDFFRVFFGEDVPPASPSMALRAAQVPPAPLAALVPRSHAPSTRPPRRSLLTRPIAGRPASSISTASGSRSRSRPGRTRGRGSSCRGADRAAATSSSPSSCHPTGGSPGAAPTSSASSRSPSRKRCSVPRSPLRPSRVASCSRSRLAPSPGGRSASTARGCPASRRPVTATCTSRHESSCRAD
jgi:curved DNA-binding protein CbpA